MTFKDFLQELNEFAHDHPEALRLEVITPTDEECNDYFNLTSDIILGHYDGGWLRDEEETLEEELKPNVVCIG